MLQWLLIIPVQLIRHVLWSQQMVQLFGKSTIYQTPLVEQPVHPFFQVQWAWEWKVVFLSTWYFVYQLLSMRSLPPLRLKRTPCLVLRPHMRNSTGSPVFSDFQSDLSRVAVSRPLVKGNEDAGYEGGVDRPSVIAYNFAVTYLACVRRLQSYDGWF